MRQFLRAALIAATVAAAVPNALAGAIHLRWAPVADADLAGYRVYWGTSSGSYSGSRDVGNVTSAAIDGLGDCTVWYLAVKAYDAAGNLSASYSNEISGWPRPALSAVAPAAVEQGRTLSLAVAGANFRPGATVQFGAPGITVNSVAVASCTSLTVGVTVGSSAAVGAGSVEVTNPDSVYGAGPGLFTVLAAAAPTVTSTSPSNGATRVAVTVRPAVTFSEAMLPSSVTSSTVRLLDGAGSPVAQAAGSPALSSDGVTATITPAASLAAGGTFRIEVAGGTTGVYDLANHPMAATYRQSTGFSTTPDTDEPEISAVQSTGVTATTARITWTTDEDADSQVFYRKSGQSGFQQTAIDAAMVESHSVALQGLEPSSAYEYYARSVDSAGNAATSSPLGTFSTSSSTYSYVEFDAEGGALVSPVRATSGAGAFGGVFIDTPSGTATGTATSPAGTATFGVNLPTAGTWYLWVRLYGPGTSSDSWFESVDGAARQEIVAPETGAWTWVAGRSYSLSAGLHSVELGGREAEARADRVLLTNDASFRPTEQPVDDQTPTQAVAAFAAVASDRQIALGWTNPPDADFRKTVLRYRTDGRYPTSPVDGYAVAERPASPGSADGYVHAGLTNGVTYLYGAFAVDAAGNVAPSARALAQPIDDVAPAIVTNVQRADTRP